MSEQSNTHTNSTNYSEDEINKFNQLAPNWWDKNGPMKALHQVNPIRTQYILNNLNRTDLKNLDILDIGCGAGILSEGLSKLGANVTGVDMSKDAINIAKIHAHSDNQSLDITYINTSIEEHCEHCHNSNNYKQYDVITCLELLEHVPDPKKFISYIKKILKPNGKLFISTLNRNLKCYLLAIVGAEYILNMIPRGTHEYNKFIKPSEMAEFLRSYDLKINNIKGIVYNPLSGKFSISDDTDVNYILCSN